MSGPWSVLAVQGSHLKVRIKIRVRLADGTYPFLDPVLSANGKLKSLHAFVGGKPEHLPEGCYFLRYADGKPNDHSFAYWRGLRIALGWTAVRVVPDGAASGVTQKSLLWPSATRHATVSPGTNTLLLLKFWFTEMTWVFKWRRHPMVTMRGKETASTMANR
jgi:hypothetical protein